MEKRKTVLIAILSLLLAALICAAAVLGVALARSAFSDADEMYAGEARWKISALTAVNSPENELFVSTEKFMPTHAEYDRDAGARKDTWFGLAAVLENDGDVAASVTVTTGEGATGITDGCGSADDGRYSNAEIIMHFDAEVFCCISDGITGADEARLSHVEGATLGVGDRLYFYAEITWTTDLDRDINDYYLVYDGFLGDEFDTWAGEHLAGISFPVNIKAEQAA